MVKNEFYRKHPKGNDDYQTAFELVHSLRKSQSKEIEPNNLPAFRKYICDLAMKNGIAVTTRRIGGVLKVIRIE